MKDRGGGERRREGRSEGQALERKREEEEELEEGEQKLQQEEEGEVGEVSRREDGVQHLGRGAGKGKRGRRRS